MASSIQFLRSTIAQERPFSGNLLEGQPAINLNASEPGLFFKATDGSVIKIGPVAITDDGSPPNSLATGLMGNSVGELWFDASTPQGVLKIYDGSAWLAAGIGGLDPTVNANLQVIGDINISGNLMPTADITYDIGAPGSRFANVYSGDLHLSNQGKVNSVDGTWGDWTLQEGAEDVFMINNRTGAKFRVLMEPA